MQNSAWIKDGLLVTKGNLLFFLPKPLFSFFFGMPLREQRVPLRAERKQSNKQGEFFDFFFEEIF